MSRGLLVVIPTYNERENIASTVERALAAEPDAEVLVVDDRSPDGTGSFVAAWAEREPRLHLLARPGKLGFASAYLDGFRWGLERGYAFLCQMDADGQHDPAALPRLVAAIRDGADLAIGSRYVAGGTTPGWSRNRRWLSRGGNWYARTVLGVPVRDVTGGFKLYRREALEAIGLDRVATRGYAFQIELTFLAIRRGCRPAEVPIAFGLRRHGASKMTLAIMFEAYWTVLRLRLAAPPQRHSTSERFSVAPARATRPVSRDEPDAS